MPILLPNLTITEISTDTQASQSGKISDIIIVCTRSTIGTAANNVATSVSSLTELTAKIGTVPATTIASFEAIRAIAPSANIYVLPGFSSVGGATQAQHLAAGLAALTTGAMAINLAVVVAPEVASLATPADRVTCFTAAETAVATDGFDWLYFSNFGLDVQTKAQADTARTSMLSAQGNSSHYFGFIQDSSSRTVPLSAIAAAYLIQLNQTNDGFFSPAANGTIIPGTVLSAYRLSLDDAKVIVNDRSFNFPWLTSGNQWQIWGDHTASSDASWNFINTRLAASTVQQWLSEVLADQIYKPVDSIDSSGEGIRTREVIGRVTQVMERAKTEGALSVPRPLSDGTTPPPYRLVTTPLANGTASLEVRFNPIRSLRQITIRLTVTQRP